MSVVPDAATPLVVRPADIERHVSPQLALDAARAAAVAALDQDTAVGRITLPFPGGWMRILGCALPSRGVFGYKEFHLDRRNAVRYAVHVFCIDDGRPLGVVDGALLTPLRTAAAATAAAVRWAENGPERRELRVGIIGSGAEARAGLRALCAALPVRSAWVTSRSPENRVRFATEMSTELALPIEAAPDVTSAARDGTTDVVYVATNSGGRVVVTHDEVASIPLVLSIGSTLPEQRELDASVLRGAASVVVDTPDVLHESGDALAAGLPPDGVVLLGRYLEDPVPDGPRTVYKSIGSPEQDVTLAAAILEAATDEGFGQPLSPLSAVKHNLPPRLEEIVDDPV